MSLTLLVVSMCCVAAGAASQRPVSATLRGRVLEGSDIVLRSMWRLTRHRQTRHALTDTTETRTTRNLDDVQEVALA